MNYHEKISVVSRERTLGILENMAAHGLIDADIVSLLHAHIAEVRDLLEKKQQPTRQRWQGIHHKFRKRMRAGHSCLFPRPLLLSGAGQQRSLSLYWSHSLRL